MAGSEEDENSNVLILLDSSGKKIWQYHSSGNWHEVNFSADGSYITGATGCPDRRGYLFSKGSNEPIFRSEPLSKESPIDESKISSDGNLTVFGVESSFGAVVLMSRATKEIVWRYETADNRSVRALAMTPNGEFIGAGTFGGDVLIFNKNSNKPVEQLKINSAIGAFDIADDGSFFATGSADKKVRVFEKGKNEAKTEIALEEYVGELDISANGKLVVAGTSGSVYFFESIIDFNSVEVSDCKEVIEPPKEDTSLFGGQNGGDEIDKNESFLSPVIISTSCLGLCIISLFIYLALCRKSHLSYKKTVITIFGLLIIFCLGATIYFWRFSGIGVEKDTVGSKETSPEGVKAEEAIQKEAKTVETNESSNDQNIVETEGGSSNSASETTNVVESNPSSDEGDCGNGICEPNLGETKDNCKDCSGSN
jgi:hypothetical protein